MNTYLVSLLLAFLSAAALTPIVLHLANRWEIIDAAGLSHRKVHNESKPRLGGIAIALSFFVPLLGLMVYETQVGNHIVDNPSLIIGFLVGGALITLLGVYDDVYGATAKTKFSVQILIATFVSIIGFNIPVIDLPFLEPIHLGILAYPAAIFWIVAITNAVNLVDGLDGLAAGIALIAITPMTIISLTEANVIMALICFTLTGSLLGFLIFNFHPARIFMGDSGSLFLGYILAIVSVHTSTKGGSAVIIMTPLLALGLPILDTTLAIVRRAWYGMPLFSGDKNHIHHKLMDKGLSHRSTVLVLYGVAASFAGLALITYLYRDFNSGLTLAVSALISAVLVYKVGYINISKSLQADLTHSHAVREHNKLIREGFAETRASLSSTHDIEAICSKVLAICRLIDAASASLDLRASRADEPIRTWNIHPDATLAEPISFNIAADHKQVAGCLTLTWSINHDVHEGLMQSVEECCHILSSDLNLLEKHEKQAINFENSKQKLLAR